MTWFANLPVQRKLGYAMLATTTVALVVACAVFLAVEYRGYRRDMGHTVATLAKLTADNSTAALAFADRANATQNLEALHAEPQIVSAALYDDHGQLFASFRATPDEILDGNRMPRAAGASFAEPGHVVRVQPVMEGARRLGTLYVRASMAQIFERMQTYAWVVLVVLVSSFALAGAVASRLRHALARPILELANTAHAVATAQDYSLRARHYGNDELGRLTLAFNAMLRHTQAVVGALRESEAQLRLVTDNAPVLLLRLDHQHRYTFVNRSYAERNGYQSAAMIGLRTVDVVGPKAHEVFRPHVEAALAGERVEFEAQVPYSRIGVRWVHVVYVPERGSGGEVVGVLGVLEDTGARKEAEIELKRARDEALAASQAKDDFLAALSHELRTPLNPVLLLASDAASRADLPPAIRADFELINKNVNLEARLIDDLLDLTRISRGKLRLEERRCDLHAILRDALANVKGDLGGKGQQLTVDFEEGETAVWGDSVRLQQVFWNILKNAVKFTAANGRIAVRARRGEDGGKVAVTITDSGIGMSPQEIGRVFQAFSQGDHAVPGAGSHRFGGLGLGLAISRMLVELHAGRVHAASAGRGRGSTFTVELPLYRADATTGDASPAASWSTASAAPLPVVRAAVAPPAPSRWRRVLIVEDHAATRLTLQHLLRNRDYYVAVAGSATEALRLARADEFDLVISDVGLPDRSGYELMADLRKIFPELAGIALSGYGMEDDLARSRAAGFALHLVKPVTIGMLEDAVARLAVAGDKPHPFACS